MLEFLADVAGADVGGVGALARIDIAVEIGEEGRLVDIGHREAPKVDFLAAPVGGDIDNSGAVGAFGRFVEDALAGVGAIDSNTDEVVVCGGADEGSVEGDDNPGRGDKRGSTEMRGVHAAAGEDEVGIVNGDAVGGAGMEEVIVVVGKEGARDVLLLFGRVGVAMIDGGGEDGGELCHGFEDGTVELLLEGIRIANEGVVRPVDVAAFPQRGYDRAEFSDLGSHEPA